MDPSTAPTPAGRTRDGSSITPEVRIGKRVFAVSSVIAVVAWAVELHAGVITPWDLWLVPALAVLLAAAALWMHLQPQSSLWPRTIACVVVNTYFVASALMIFHSPPGPERLHQLFTGLYWLPLGYAMAFIFLPVRIAVLMSIVVFAAMFVPVGISLLTASANSWGSDLRSLIAVLATAQVGYIVVLLSVATMRSALHRDRERLRITEQMANTDLLTGLSSRRACDDLLSAALEHATATATPLTVMLVDIDHFKRINDTHGHAAGDRALHDIGRVMTSQLRATDHVGRWGGEEFLVIAPAANMHAGMQLAERLRAAVEGFPFAHGERVTVSIGVAPLLAGDDARQLLARADRALYRAKHEGRNRLAAERLALATVPG